MFNNAKEGLVERVTLEELGHPQGKTKVICDNSTAVGITNRSIKHKRSKAMDMRYYWCRDREAQNQFRFIWLPGKFNIGDYYTKHHPASHHKAMRSTILNYPTQRPSSLRGCADLHKYANQLQYRLQGHVLRHVLPSVTRRAYKNHKRKIGYMGFTPRVNSYSVNYLLKVNHLPD